MRNAHLTLSQVPGERILSSMLMHMFCLFHHGAKRAIMR
jgi:hypothetical protein